MTPILLLRGGSRCQSFATESDGKADIAFAQLIVRRSSQLDCLVWMAPALQGLWLVWRFGRVQSCVRPVDAVQMTAGLDGFRGSGPILLCGLWCPGRKSGFPHPRSDRSAITSHRPRNR